MVDSMWPTRRFGPRVRWIVSGLQLVGAGLAGTWALGVLVLVGIVSTNISGSSTLFALTLAALICLLAAMCREEVESGRIVLSQLLPIRRRSRRRSRPPDVAFCLSTWLDVLTYLAALTVCSRALSSTMDYITGGKTELWIKLHFGTLPQFLGGATPDIIGLGVALVPTVLFTLGMEHSSVLRALLNFSIIGCVIFLAVVGSQHTDLENWEPHGGFGSEGILSAFKGAAFCSFGFLGFITIHKEGKSSGKGFQLVAIVTTVGLSLITYYAVSAILSLMVEFGTLEDSSVLPLVKVFEIRDVDWARLVIAIFIIFGLSMTLLEVCPPLHEGIIKLSSDECQLLPQLLSLEHPATGTSAWAILISGTMASFLACICPLEPLIRIMCAAPLLGHAVASLVVLHRRYQLPLSVYLAEHSGVKYKRLGNQQLKDEEEFDDDDTDMDSEKNHRHMTVRCLKSGLSFLPTVIRQHVATENQRYYTTVASPDFISGDMSHSMSNGTVATAVSFDNMSERNIPNGTIVSKKSPDLNYISKDTLYSQLSNSVQEPHSIQNGSAVSDKKYLYSVTNGTISKHPSDVDVPKISESSRYINGLLAPNNYSVVKNSGSVLAANSQGSSVTAQGKSNRTKNSASTLKNSRRNNSREDEVSLIEENGNDSEEESTTSTSDGDADESDNSTDIDAIVAEYKERIQVATTPTTPQPVCENPTVATARRASLSLIGAIFSGTIIGVGSVLPGYGVLWCGLPGLVGFIASLAILSRQPQSKESWHSAFGVPWIPGGCFLLSYLCSFQLLTTVWPATLLWIIAGGILYWAKHGRGIKTPMSSRRGATRRERIRLNAPPRQSTISTVVPSHRRYDDSNTRRLTQVDTIIISR